MQRATVAGRAGRIRWKTMNARPFLAACLVGTTLLGARPRPVHAQEAEPAPVAPWVAPIQRADAISPRIVDSTRTMIAHTTVSSLPQAASPTTELLSRGARIAIIVSAIVLGVIILVGVFTIGAPHHP